MPRNPDVVVIGAGIVGSAIALELAREKKNVLVLERGEIGAGASWAAGGVLTPVHLAEYPGPLAAICVASQKMFDGYVRDLNESDLDYRTTGMLFLVLDDKDESDATMLEAWKKQRGAPVERLDAAQARAGEPAIGEGVRRALLLPDVAQIRNHRLTRAVATAAKRLGAEFRTQTEVTGFLRVPGRINGIKTSKGDIFAGEIVIAAGAWSAPLLESLDLKAAVHPVRGQIALLDGPPGAVKRVLLSRDQYLIPRSDGKILLGSTVEDAGFDASVTVGGLGSLIQRVLQFAPGVKNFPIVKTWAGLRPATADRLPYIGRPAGYHGLILATGHFRNGILLGPLTGKIVADLIAGRTPPVDLAPFHPDR